jgi:hypothetical protein
LIVGVDLPFDAWIAWLAVAIIGLLWFLWQHFKDE